MPEPEIAPPERVREEIARELRQVQEESYGAGVRDIQVHVAGDFVLAILDVELTRAEETLLDAGRGDTVKASRDSFQAAIGPTFTAIVERATGRKVDSFISSMSLEPLFSVELFRLAPPSG